MEYGPKYVDIPPLAVGGRQARVKVSRETNYFMQDAVRVTLQEKRKHFGWREVDSTTGRPRTAAYPDGWDFSDMPSVIQGLTDRMVERVQVSRKNDRNLDRYLTS